MGCVLKNQVSQVDPTDLLPTTRGPSLKKIARRDPQAPGERDGAAGVRG